MSTDVKNAVTAAESYLKELSSDASHVRLEEVERGDAAVGHRD